MDIDVGHIWNRVAVWILRSERYGDICNWSPRFQIRRLGEKIEPLCSPHYGLLVSLVPVLEDDTEFPDCHRRKHVGDPLDDERISGPLRTRDGPDLKKRAADWLRTNGVPLCFLRIKMHTKIAIVNRASRSRRSCRVDLVNGTRCSYTLTNFTIITVTFRCSSGSMAPRLEPLKKYY